MQKQEFVSLEIERLLFELTVCVNGLQACRQQLFIDDSKQVELNLNKLELLISFVRNSRNVVRLSVA